jgi:hypothetical protein
MGTVCLKIATKRKGLDGIGRLAGALVSCYIQSIIGATEKRRESGAGVAVIRGIGVSGMGEAGRRGEFIRIGLAGFR